MVEVKQLSRIERAKPQLQLIAHLLFIMEQPEPKDYLILAAVKYFKSISSYAKAETVRHLLSIPKREFNQRVSRMREQGWVVIDSEYINVAQDGEKKLDALSGWISFALYNIQERKPLEEWSKL